MGKCTASLFILLALFFTSPENSAKWCIASGNISPYLATSEVPTYVEYLKNNQALKVVADSIVYSTGLPSIAGTYTVRVELEKMATLAVAGSKPLSEIISDSVKVCSINKLCYSNPKRFLLGE